MLGGTGSSGSWAARWRDGEWYYLGSDPVFEDGSSAEDFYYADDFHLVEDPDGWWIDAVCSFDTCYPVA